jgi:recombination protein RecA
MAKKAKKLGRLNLKEMRNLVNKKAGTEIAFSLSEDNPTDVKQWISTGSRWLDNIICKGKRGGIPMGKVVELAGLESTGKSYMAAQIAANAQKMGIDVVYFDSESAIDSAFLEGVGCDLSEEPAENSGWFMYTQAHSVEVVLEMIEEMLGTNTNPMLFIWDSVAQTPCEADIAGDFNPLATMALKPRILSKGVQKLTQPIANTQSTLLVLNQLKTNITSNIAEAMTTPYFTPGGKALPYTYSLRMWLTSRKSKASFVLDENGFRVGSEVKVTLKKSRFGTQGRQCTFKILWGGQVAIQDEESWFEAIKMSSALEQSGAWYNLLYEDGTSEKFQAAKWMDKLQSPKFRERVLQIMDEELITRFEKKEGSASDFYEVDPEE